MCRSKPYGGTQFKLDAFPTLPKWCLTNRPLVGCGMEGICDGLAVDRCFYCDLLYPDLSPCPRCGNRLRYQSARMANAEDIERDIADLIARFRRAPSLAHATALLTFVHEIGEHAADHVEDSGLALASLRPFFAHPPTEPSPEKADRE